MVSIKEIYKSGDWKAEKHVPVITSPDQIKKGEALSLEVSVGKEIPHPNTSEHFISWIEVFFMPDGGKFPFQIGRFDFAAHGSSPDGPNTSTIYTEPKIHLSFKTEKSGTIIATSYCNIHGLWDSAKTITVV